LGVFEHRGNKQTARHLHEGTGTDATGYSMETAMYCGVHHGPNRNRHKTVPPHKVTDVGLSGANAAIEIPMDLITGYGL
jgi:hypothetical protein